MKNILLLNILLLNINMSIKILSLEPKIISSTITEEELNEIKSKEFLEYLQSIDKILYNKDIYDYIYISIGCKKNEDYINTKKTPSNSIYQMFPNFLLSFKNPLVLLIDNFNFKYDDMGNMAIIQNWVNSKDEDNSKEVYRTVYIIDYIFELNALIELIKHCFNNYIPQKWMICNYIRFKYEDLVNKDIGFYNQYIDNLKKLYYDETYHIYFTNLYMWNGYENFFTDLITIFEYIYIDIKSKDIVFLRLHLQYTSEKFNSQKISIYNILEFLYQYNKKYKFKYNLDNKYHIDDFFQHSIDVTNFYNFKEQNENNLFSIYETLKLSNKYF